MQIKTKQQFYDLYYRLALGNTIRQWEHDKFVELVQHNAVTKDIDGVAVRCYIKDNPWMKYELQPGVAIAYVDDICRKHNVSSKQFQYSELAPDHRLILQGEVMRSRRYVDGKFCTKFYDDPAKNRMRVSMQRAEPMQGLRPWLLMKNAMDGPSWDCLQELWNLYPDSIIEFAVYDIGVGVLEWNTIIWECRDY